MDIRVGWITILLLLASLLLLAGCAVPVDVECPECEVCEECSDCPVVECPQLDCDSCPAKIQTKNITVEVTKYVCLDGSIVDNATDCSKVEVYDFEPVTTNEDSSYIENATLSPACVMGEQGGTIFFDVGRIPNRIAFETKLNADDPFEERFEIRPGLFSNYNYFAICKGCPGYGDFVLLPDRVYLFRMKFEYDEETQFSNEHIIDTRPSSDYMQKSC